MAGAPRLNSAGRLAELRAVLQWVMRSWLRPAGAAADWEQDVGSGSSPLSSGAQKRPIGAAGTNAERGRLGTEGAKSTPQGH